ncbi:MAG: type II toxin-antitoxin system VapC family toxin [Cyanobacteria bacterium P01_E01_bin.42]
MTQLLLDTHIFIWYSTDDPKLGSALSNHLEDSDNALFLSIASLWEIAIKLNIGKLNLGCPFPELCIFCTDADITILPIAQADLEFYLGLPLHHRDPFDRLIISQAITRSLTVVSRDAMFAAYSVDRLWL